MVHIQKLIKSAQQGDAEAFGEVYTKLFTPLYRYILSRSHDVELTNDLCQQTFLKFYEALPGYKPEKSPLAYLFTIARNLLINNYEKKTFATLDEGLLESYKDDSDPLEDAHVALLASSINDYLPELSEDEREVIRLYFFSELSYEEIATVLNKEEASLRKIKERALKKLRVLTSHLNVEN
jgi:RNA polymerase sigma-70 factor (ECF subfamily)